MCTVCRLLHSMCAQCLPPAYKPKYVLIYHPKQKLTSNAVQINLANTCANEKLCEWKVVCTCRWTLKFHKVVQHQIWGEVTELIPASSTFYLTKCKCERITFARVIIKIIKVAPLLWPTVHIQVVTEKFGLFFKFQSFYYSASKIK